MQLVDLEISYEEIIDKTEENKKFINDTNDWKKTNIDYEFALTH